MKRSSAAISLGWLVLIVCLCGGVASGQERLGSLQGAVADDTGAVLPGVAVTLTNKSDRKSTRLNSSH